MKIKLNAEGSGALEAIMKATGLNQTEVIHRVLVEEARRRGTVVRASYSDRVGSTGEDVPFLFRFLPKFRV